jgi:Holliday junction DNA helicase RuvA
VEISANVIARLSGTLAEVTADSAVIDVGGVGYLVQMSGKTLAAIGGVGAEVMILTELQVREDAWTLFGFGSTAERDSFRALTSIQGVGGRLALAILSVLSPDELARAVAHEDKAMIGRANGVGPKLAARIANELQGKLGVAGLGGAAPAPRAGAAADALSALANLGFKPAEASAAVNAAQDELGPEATLDALVRLALRKAAK